LSAETIDLHFHLLPGIDDGPAGEADALAAAAAAAGDGTTTVAATPHVREDFPGVVPAELAARCGRLGEALRGAGIDLEVVPAGELDIAWALEANDEELRLVSYGQRGTDLLIETPYGALSPRFEELLFELQLKRFRLLLAHPERSRAFQADPDRLAALVARGVLLQVTADSVVAGRRRGAGSLAHELLRRELVHVLASDAHGALTADRAPLSEAVAVTASVVGERQARWLVGAAPRAILEGGPLPDRPPAERRGGRLARLAGRRRRGGG
jgi:protein-tyrosine phosphatase